MDANLRSTLNAIEDELGIDAYCIFQDGKKHFAVEAVIMHFALALLTTYIMSLLGIKEIATKHREYLVALKKKLLTTPAPLVNIDKETEQLAEDLQKVLLNTQPSGGVAQVVDIYEKANKDIVDLLLESGMSERRAMQVAERVKIISQKYMCKSMKQNG